MAELRARPSRVLTTSVWASGALLGVIFIQYVTGWGGDSQARLINDLAYVPVVALTAALGLRLVRGGRLDGRERRAWILFEVSFACQVLAHAASLVRNLVTDLPAYPTVSDLL